MKKQILIGMSALVLPLTLLAGSPDAPELSFEDQSVDYSVFANKTVNEADYTYTYMPYNEWKATPLGKSFPMSVAPVLEGLADGGVRLPAPQPVDPSKYEGQAAEFAAVVNMRNEGGRASLEPTEKSPAVLLANAEKTTHVVELRLSALIDKNFESMDISEETIAEMANVVDVDHYHFQIPGSFVAEALEENHAAFPTLDMNRNYLLSVFDMKDYECSVMRSAIRDQAAKKAPKDQLQNDSIYVVSNVSLNQEESLMAAESYLGKRPAAVITQDSIYASHMLRGSRTIFAFYPEGEKTRIVLLSNIAMASRFFEGAEGIVARQYILDGVAGITTDAALGAKKAYDQLSNLISGATQDVVQKNSCDRGLGLGLVKYSQKLFQKFVEFTIE